MSENKKRKIMDSDIFSPTPCPPMDTLKAYHQNRLSRHARHNIEKHLIDCVICSDILEGMAVTDEEKARPLIDQLKQKLGFEKPQKQSPIRWVYAIAAVCIVVLIPVLVLIQLNRSPESLFNRYFEPYPNTIPLFRGEAPASPLEKAMVEYEMENYETCYILLGEILNMDSDQPAALFYAGVSSLAIGRPDNAIVHFQQIISAEENEFQEPAMWYLGLAYLKNKEINQAKSIFEQIRLEDSSYQQKSTKLLKSLN